MDSPGSAFGTSSYWVPVPAKPPSIRSGLLESSFLSPVLERARRGTPHLLAIHSFIDSFDSPRE